MYNLSYLPQSDGFILSHSRDEDPKRPSSQKIKADRVGEIKLFYPQDLKAKGTWIGINHLGRVACLLNGGHKPYLTKAKSAYPFSRGQVVIDLLAGRSPKEALKSKDYRKLEPFTLIYGDSSGLYQWTHDPHDDELIFLDPEKPHFWSSTKLYNAEQRRERAAVFEEWLASTSPKTAAGVRSLHLEPSQGNSKTSFRLEVPDLIKTVSFCQVQGNQKRLIMSYENLIDASHDQIAIELSV
jgi:hypothetical protein